MMVFCWYRLLSTDQRDGPSMLHFYFVFFFFWLFRLGRCINNASATVTHLLLVVPEKDGSGNSEKVFQHVFPRGTQWRKTERGKKENRRIKKRREDDEKTTEYRSLLSYLLSEEAEDGPSCRMGNRLRDHLCGFLAVSVARCRRRRIDTLTRL